MDNELLIMILFIITFLVIYKYITIEKNNVNITESFKTDNTVDTENTSNNNETEDILPIRIQEHPKNSKDFINTLSYKDAIEEGKSYYDSYKLMVGNIQSNVSKEELIRIQGKDIKLDTNNENLFNPVYANFDPRYFNKLLNQQNNTKYKIRPNDIRPVGSSL